MIRAFNTNHVKAVVKDLLGADHYVHSDGATIVINTGSGAVGKANAERVAAVCKFPTEIKTSKRLGSVAQIEAWEAAGVNIDYYVSFNRPG